MAQPISDEELVLAILTAALSGLLARAVRGNREDIGDQALALARYLAQRIKDEGPLPP